MACKNCKDVVVESCDTCYCSDTVCTPCKIKLADRCITITSNLPGIAPNLECKDLNTVLLAINNKLSSSLTIASNQFFATDGTANFPGPGDNYRWAGEIVTGVNLWDQNNYTEGLDAPKTGFTTVSDQRMAGIPVPFDIAAGEKIVLTGTFSNLHSVQVNGKVEVGVTPCAGSDTSLPRTIAPLVEASTPANNDIVMENFYGETMYSTCFRKEFNAPEGGITKGSDLLVVGWQLSRTLTASDKLVVAWTLSV
tara:strand:- start:817 stop:1572 length:756 start_codon:yes stop_codon:yes gene_type:complete